MTDGIIIRHLTPDDHETALRLFELGDRVIAEGHDRTVFGNNLVYSSLDRLATDGFLYAVYRSEVPLGFFWLDRFESKRCARINFCTFRAIGSDLLKCGRDVIGWLVPQYFDSLLGCTANPPAIKYLTKLGFEILGMVKLSPDINLTISLFPPQN